MLQYLPSMLTSDRVHTLRTTDNTIQMYLTDSKHRKGKAARKVSGTTSNSQSWFIQSCMNPAKHLALYIIIDLSTEKRINSILVLAALLYQSPYCH
jgi:hypothetical protein